MLRYIPDSAKATYQGQLHSAKVKKKYADETNKNKKVIKFNVQLTKRHYNNFQNVYFCLALKFKSPANNCNNTLAVLITVNNFFVHWIKEIDIKRYGDGIPILPLTNTVDIYQYSEKMLKNMPKNVLKAIQIIFCIAKRRLLSPATGPIDTQIIGPQLMLQMERLKI